MECGAAWASSRRPVAVSPLVATMATIPGTLWRWASSVGSSRPTTRSFESRERSRTAGWFGLILATRTDWTSTRLPVRIEPST